MILEAYNSHFTRNEAMNICKCHPFPFLNVNYVYKSKRAVQKAKILSTKVLKPHRYKNIHVLGFVRYCMICFNTRIVSASQDQPCHQLPSPRAQPSWSSKIPFSKHTPHQKSTSNRICNMESRTPSFQFLPSRNLPWLGVPTRPGTPPAPPPTPAFSGNMTVINFQRGMWSFGDYKGKFEIQKASQFSFEVPVSGSINVLKALCPFTGKRKFQTKIISKGSGHPGALPTVRQERRGEGPCQHSDRSPGMCVTGLSGRGECCTGNNW